MLDKSTIPTSILNFKDVIRHFEGDNEDYSHPIVGIKRPREEDDDVSKQESTLDRVHFLSHKNLATIYYKVYLLLLEYFFYFKNIVIEIVFYYILS